MKTKLKSILAVALCAVGFAAFAAEPDAVQLWEGGPYFATCNVGANAPQESGYYFWWGDTVGYVRNGSSWDAADGSKTGFSFSSGNCPTYDKTIKQLYNDGNGYIDANSADGKLKPAYDAATAHLGAPWRMMTKDELELLTNTAYCVSVWTNDYNETGVAGQIVTGVTEGYTDKSIFLPAAGVGDGLAFNGANMLGFFWSSTPSSDNSDCACALNLVLGDFKASRCSRGAGTPVRPVRDTPPEKPEISAVSAEGFLDLTVGDRVAEAEETLVVDPAWGEAATATVKIEGEELRQYNALTIDTWQTAALTAGRYGMTFTSGETNETAAFWKTGDDWVVLDLPSYSTAGIEFQSDKTYLALGQYEFAGTAPLTVLDGAKFEYGTGAGFKGGKLEMPRRYRKETIEGGLYRIVEAIKGSEDNPWVIGGDGVEAYTNGTELVIVGKGTIADLSEIPADVKFGIGAITVADALKAMGDAFMGFNNIALTLPDNWQDVLPDDKGIWNGATQVTLTAWPKAVKNVKVLQRYPWNGLVDIDFALSGEGPVKVTVQVTVDGKKLANPTVTGDVTADLGDGKELKDLRITWDAKADFGDEEKHEKIKVKLTVSPAEAN